jgi:chromosome segregation ATPase
VDPLLKIADDLERRDELAAEALREVEALQSDVDELRVHAATVAAFLRELPPALSALEDEERSAGEAQARAAEVLRHAEEELARVQERGGDSARLEAARAEQHARDGLEAAEQRVSRAHRERELLEREASERGDEAERLERRGAELSLQPRLAHDVAPPATGLHGLLDWASRARGELLVAHAALATERDKVVREATELLAGALGEPLLGTGVAGVKERLSQALGIH